MAKRVFEISIYGYSDDVSVKMVLTPTQIKAMIELVRLVRKNRPDSAPSMDIWELDEDEAEAFIG